MDILLLIFFLTIIPGIQLKKQNDWNTDYMRVGNTRAVNGIFVMMVFLAHASSYLELGSGDQAYHIVRRAFSQLIVAPFFFYSGYGICRSALEKGRNYVQTLPYRRVLRVWYHFAIAVCFYWILLKVYGYRINPPKIPLVFLGWHSIGNSNWFIFDILLFYLLSWISFMAFGKNPKRAVWCNLALCILFGFVLAYVKAPDRYYYHLILIYPCGVLFGYYQPKIEAWIRNSQLGYKAILMISILVFATMTLYRKHVIVFEFYGVLFIWILVLLTMKIRVGNRGLDYLGNHIFEIYIYQRIPMIILYHYGIVQHHFLYGACCFAITLVLATAAKFGMDRLDTVLHMKAKIR